VKTRCLSTLAALVALGLVAALTAAAAPPDSLTEFSAGLNAGSIPFRLVSGADGAVWFTDQGTTKAIGRVTTDGSISELALAPPAVPRQIRVGPDGAIWFTDTGTPAIGRIGVAGSVTSYPLPAGSVPTAMAIGSDGNLWFTDRGPTPAVWRIAGGGAMTPFSAGLNAGSLPNGIVPGPDGNLWFTDQGSTRALGRVTTGGAITEFSAGLNAGSLPSALTPGPDGNLWFTDQGTTRAIGKLTTAGAITELQLASTSNPQEITPGADGSLWFTDRGAAKAIAQVTPTATGATIVYHPLPSTTLPGGIRTGPDGNLWFADNGTPQALGRFGVGAPAASTAAPAMTGRGIEDSPQTCDGATWSDWAGSQPSVTAFAFDGIRWLRDGAVVASGASYTPTAADVGHALACEVVATYTLFPTTVSATSAPLVVVKSAAHQLADLAAAAGGVGPGLGATVAAARLFLAHGQTGAACVLVAAFQREVRAETGLLILAPKAADLTAAARGVEDVLGC
jgi:virginiamycin B lyase